MRALEIYSKYLLYFLCGILSFAAFPSADFVIRELMFKETILSESRRVKAHTSNASRNHRAARSSKETLHIAFLQLMNIDAILIFDRISLRETTVPLSFACKPEQVSKVGQSI